MHKMRTERVSLVSRRTILGAMVLPFSGIDILPNLALADDQTSLAAQQAFDWINGPDGLSTRGTIIKGVTDSINKAIGKNQDIWILVDHNLTKTEEYSLYLCLYANQFFAFKMSEEETSLFELKANTIRHWTKDSKDFAAPSLSGTIRSLEIYNAKHLNGNANIKGSLECHRLNDEHMEYAIRVTYHLKNSTTSHFNYLPKNSALPEGLYKFTSGVVNNPDDEEKYIGPALMFVDFVTLTPEPENKAIRRTNTLGALTNVVVS